MPRPGPLLTMPCTAEVDRLAVSLRSAIRMGEEKDRVMIEQALALHDLRREVKRAIALLDHGLIDKARETLARQI